MSEGKTFTEMLPEFAAEAERNPDRWWEAFEKRYALNRLWTHGASLSIFLQHCDETRYRRKLKTVKRTIEHPEGLGEAPAVGTRLFVAATVERDFFAVFYWDNDLPHHHRYLERGLLHATKEAAIAHGKALANVGDG